MLLSTETRTGCRAWRWSMLATRVTKAWAQAPSLHLCVVDCAVKAGRIGSVVARLVSQIDGDGWQAYGVSALRTL
ncbi:hypothetical protein EDB86DRAFT_2933777 [Lactarius hatsudake]|nr:hypothetical protein EDB86DRAFT_2933777 [Lactarius hatsudake]